jgi:hypothetical protein
LPLHKKILQKCRLAKQSIAAAERHFSGDIGGCKLGLIAAPCYMLAFHFSFARSSLRGAFGLQMQNPAVEGGVANPLEWKAVIE